MNGDICPNCRSFDTTEAEYVDVFDFTVLDYGLVQVTAKYPVITCAKCKESFSDWRGENARTEATINALGDALRAVANGMKEIENDRT